MGWEKGCSGIRCIDKMLTRGIILLSGPQEHSAGDRAVQAGAGLQVPLQGGARGLVGEDDIGTNN